jgi:serine/threonine-protein kinase
MTAERDRDIPVLITQLPLHEWEHTSSGGERTTNIPAEILGSAIGRVRIAALISAALWGLVLVFNVALPYLGFHLTGAAGWPFPNWIYAAIGIVGSLGLAHAAGRLSDKPHLVLDLGLGLEVFTAALIGGILAYQFSPHAARISWAAVVILVYPAIAPSRPRRALAAGLIAASMDGLGILVAELLGFNNNTWTREFAGNVVWSMVPNYVCAVLALLPASLIRRLGREAGAARELGSYRLGRLVQRGGMGEVYEATHRLIAKPAAIKLIRPELLSDSPAVAEVIVQRFYHEAEAVAALRSPHTVALYDFGVAADGTLYYVMELLEGIDLQRLVRDFGPLPPARAVHIIRQACDSLGEAHRRGLIHRDIKPSNVFLCQLGLTADFAKVLDFGLVRREVQQDAGVSAVLGQPGTPSYMAPEMITGTAPVDRRADVYALGCVTYWLLTGKTVFEADNPVQMMYRHAYDPPPSPSERLGSSLPPDLEALVLATLAKDPLGRPQTAEELARRLEECDTGPGWTGQQAREWWAGNLAEVRNSRS